MKIKIMSLLIFLLLLFGISNTEVQTQDPTPAPTAAPSPDCFCTRTFELQCTNSFYGCPPNRYRAVQWVIDKKYCNGELIIVHSKSLGETPYCPCVNTHDHYVQSTDVISCSEFGKY